VTSKLILPLDIDTVSDSPISREALLANSAQKKVAGTIAVPNIMN
jgi:hypothetical protein